VIVAGGRSGREPAGDDVRGLPSSLSSDHLASRRIRIRAMNTTATTDRIDTSRAALIVYDACRRA
jgi:hypothetical protein